MKYTNRFSTAALGIPFMNSFFDLSSSLSISPAHLYSLINHKDWYYRELAIPKKDGSSRILYIPSYSMKIVQRWIYEMILKHIPVSNCSMAFIPKNNGILNTAKMHVNQTYVLGMDMSDFFNSIKRDRVYRLFLSLGYNHIISVLLSELCTYKSVLPQGAVTSPYLSNLLCFRFDSRVSGLCKKRGIVYSRYADDMYFSSDNKVQLNKIRKIVTRIAINEGFLVNNKKTRFCSDYSRKTVLGLVLNNKEIHVSSKFKRHIRAELFNAIQSGNYSNRQHILGEIAYVSLIESDDTYIDRIKEYIIKQSQKSYIQSDMKLVTAYNHNKLYKDLPDCVYKDCKEGECGAEFGNK